jgi:hypothetical protein
LNPLATVVVCTSATLVLLLGLLWANIINALNFLKHFKEDALTVSSLWFISAPRGEAGLLRIKKSIHHHRLGERPADVLSGSRACSSREAEFRRPVDCDPSPLAG